MSDNTVWSSKWVITRVIDGRPLSKPIDDASPEVKMAAKMNFISSGAMIYTADYSEVASRAFAFPMFSEQGRPVFYTLFEMIALLGFVFEDCEHAILSSYKSMIDVDIDAMPFIHPAKFKIDESMRHSVRPYDRCVQAMVNVNLCSCTWGTLFRWLSPVWAATILSNYRKTVENNGLDYILSMRAAGISMNDTDRTDDTI